MKKEDNYLDKVIKVLLSSSSITFNKPLLDTSEYTSAVCDSHFSLKLFNSNFVILKDYGRWNEMERKYCKIQQKLVYLLVLSTFIYI